MGFNRPPTDFARSERKLLPRLGRAIGGTRKTKGHRSEEENEERKQESHRFRHLEKERLDRAVKQQGGVALHL